jgi:hypothetical protein
MKTRYTIAAAIVLAGLSPAASAAYYSQNFDSIGPTGTAFPAGWSVLTIDGDPSTLVIPTSAEMATASPGTSILAVWNQTDPAISYESSAINEGSTATATDRLLGTSPTLTRGSILQLSLNNDSGAPITTVRLSYDMECMADGTLKDGYSPPDELPGYSFYYLDGSTWTHLASLDLANNTVNSVGNASATFNLSTPVPNGGTLQFRWFDDNANPFSPDPMFAIDNVSVNIPEPATLSLLAVGALALIARRRKA